MVLNQSASIDQAMAANEISLRSLQGFLKKLSDAQFIWSRHDQTSSVGQHTRHVIEHYNNFLEPTADGKLSYDNRRRRRKLAQDRALTIETLTRTICRLRLPDYRESPKTLLSICTDPELPSLTVDTSIGRELMFLHSHTLHHMAVIQLLAEMQGVRNNKDFASAPSTLKLNQISNRASQ